MLTIHHKNASGENVEYHIDLVVYYCEWRRQWVAYDGNMEPDPEDGCHAYYGLGDTREAAIENMIIDLEDNYLKI